MSRSHCTVRVLSPLYLNSVHCICCTARYSAGMSHPSTPQPPIHLQRTHITLVKADAHWTGNSCVARNTVRMRAGVIANLATDVVLLAVMFAGVLHKRNSTALWRVLFVQVRVCIVLKCKGIGFRKSECVVCAFRASRGSP